MREPGREWPTCKRLSEPVLHNLASREVASRFGSESILTPISVSSADSDGSINMSACLALSLYHTSFDRFVVVAILCFFNRRTCQHQLSIQESADSTGALECQDPNKASTSASNLSEPTCKAAARVEVSLAKLKPATSPKLKPAASIEQSSHPIEPSNRTLEAAMVSYAAPKGLPQAANGRHGDGKHPSQPAAKFHKMLIKMLIYHLKIV